MKGGNVTWKATTDIQVACNRTERFKLLTYTTHNLSGSEGGGNRPIEDCVARNQYTGKSLAGNASVGDKILILDGSSLDYFEGKIEKICFAEMPCVELETVSGIKLICSETTPISLRGSTESVKAPFMTGLEVAVLDHGDFRWEKVISVADIGIKPVSRISVGGRSYAAGSDKNRLIFTHNIQKP